jgi:hypothetical protein
VKPHWIAPRPQEKRFFLRFAAMGGNEEEVTFARQVVAHSPVVELLGGGQNSFLRGCWNLGSCRRPVQLVGNGGCGKPQITGTILEPHRFRLLLSFHHVLSRVVEQYRSKFGNSLQKTKACSSLMRAYLCTETFPLKKFLDLADRNFE